MSRRVAIYCRHTTEREKRAATRTLRAAAKKEGWTVAAEFSADKKQARPGAPTEWRELRRFIEAGKADVVAVPSMDAIGDTVSVVLAEIIWLQDQGCALYVHDAGLNTVSPVDQVLFKVVEAIKAVDDAAVRNRTARPRAQAAQPELTPYQRSVTRAAMSSGVSIKDVAKSLKLSVAAVRAFAKSQKP